MPGLWLYYTADFSSVVFTCAYFQEIAQISSLCNFHYISEGIPSLMWFGLLCCGFDSCILLPDLKKCTSQGLGIISHAAKSRALTHVTHFVGRHQICLS